MIKKAAAMFKRFTGRSSSKGVPQGDMDGSIPDYILRTARKHPPARVELSPASELTTLLLGPCTVVKVIRPGDSGPVLTLYHALIDPERWPLLTYREIRAYAEAIGVETVDVLKAVEKLCGAHS